MSNNILFTCKYFNLVIQFIFENNKHSTDLNCIFFSYIFRIHINNLNESDQSKSFLKFYFTYLTINKYVLHISMKIMGHK